MAARTAAARFRAGVPRSPIGDHAAARSVRKSGRTHRPEAGANTQARVSRPVWSAAETNRLSHAIGEHAASSTIGGQLRPPFAAGTCVAARAASLLHRRPTWVCLCARAIACVHGTEIGAVRLHCKWEKGKVRVADVHAAVALGGAVGPRLPLVDLMVGAPPVARNARRAAPSRPRSRQPPPRHDWPPCTTAQRSRVGRLRPQEGMGAGAAAGGGDLAVDRARRHIAQPDLRHRPGTAGVLRCACALAANAGGADRWRVPAQMWQRGGAQSRRRCGSLLGNGFRSGRRAI